MFGVFGMFQTLLHCPNCGNEISLKEARTEVPIPELSTSNKKVQLVYTICPRCQRDFRVIGERRAAAILLGAFFGIVVCGFVFFKGSLWPLATAGALLLFQNKIVQLLIHAERVTPNPVRGSN